MKPPFQSRPSSVAEPPRTTTSSVSV